MIHVADTERKFPAQEVPYLDIALNDLFENMMEIRRANCPDWTDESLADFGTQLQWIFTVLSKWVNDHIERVFRNCFLATATDRECVRRICDQEGYTLSEASPASATVTFTCADGHPEFTIPAGTQVSTKETRTQEAIVFETGADQLVAVGVSSVDIDCTQGETVSNEILGSSNGTTGQVFVLSRKSVIWQSETIEVHDGAAWAAWTRVKNFAESAASDKHYRVESDEEGVYEIVFGDGVHGKIPVRGVNNIRVSYRVGKGSAGNVGAGTITEIVSSIQYVDSVTNANAASGGTDRETIDHARIFGPASIRNLDRAVSAEDFEALAKAYSSTKYGGVANAKAYTIGGFLVKVMIVPQSGGLPSSGLKSELQTYLNGKRVVCMGVQVIDPIYKSIDIDVDVTGFANYAPSQIASGIRDRLSEYLSPTYQDPETGLYPNGFGRDLFLSDLYAIIDGTPGVDHCTINAPSSNQIVKEYEIINVGTLDVTVTLPTGESSHFELTV